MLRRASARIDKARLAEMIQVATVDPYDESEQATGWFTVFEEHLELPFETKVLGIAVTVVSIDLRGDHKIVAICTRGRNRQAISVEDLPLPSARPAGSEWIEAYRRGRLLSAPTTWIRNCSHFRDAASGMNLSR